MSKAYVVMERAFEDSGYNHLYQKDFGYPQIVFFDLNEAYESKLNKNLEEFKYNIISGLILDYCDGELDRTFNTNNKFEAFVLEHLNFKDFDELYDSLRHPDDEENNMSDAVRNLTFEQWVEFYSYCRIEWFYVDEVDVGGVFA